MKHIWMVNLLKTINIWTAKHKREDLSYLGYILTQSFNPELCLNLCNWHRRKHAERPNNLYLISSLDKIDGCRGICFEDTSTDTWHLALSLDWLSGTQEEILQYIKDNKNERLWLKD